jgi:hypothetical protein
MVKQMLENINYRATLADAKKYLTKLEPFHAGTLSAYWEFVGGGYSYVVKSYGKEIASNCFEPGSIEPSKWGLIYDDAYEYSVTTSKHANIVKKAWKL